ncbi:hypothetical protein CCZ01_03860 [Helicobacter monodelphidis]|uniref:flagellar assembly protein FliW n=1 Tax=Helicobacter sp. 15-1451 TaxID=2004995 RepID=UPI000DCF1965|nr:flagellar assembly protein FliW [Helicobacter sp. 15-1451]RAX58218.1 hypothetical protein CCZ01_03860 [Helicobacter sp. 15-1451]
MIYTIKSPISGLEQIAKVELEQIDDRFVKVRGLKEDDTDCGIELRLINPYTLKRDYSLTIPTNIQTLLDIHNNSKVKIFCMMILQKPIESSLVNFLAPIAFNDDNQSAAQIELQAIEYPDFHVAEPISNYIHIYDVKSPILGFEQIVKLEFIEIDHMFAKIQGLREDGSECGVSMTLANPAMLKKDYIFDVPVAIQTLMDISKHTKVFIYCPVWFKTPIEESTVNLLAPIILNPETHTAAQIPLQAHDYPNYGMIEPIKKLREALS